MKVRTVTILAALACAMVATGALVWWLTAEPTYQNRPLSYWVTQANAVSHSQSNYVGAALNASGRTAVENANRQLRDAVASIGPKAIPCLFRYLRGENSDWLRFYRWVSPKLPQGVQARLRVPRPLDDRVGIGMASLIASLGPPALPRLVPALKDRDTGVRLAAVVALGQISPKPSTITLEVASLLRDTNAMIRNSATVTLGTMGPGATQAIPHLIGALKDSEMGPPMSTRLGPFIARSTSSRFPVRRNAATALGNIGPEARLAVPELSRLLSDPDPCTRLEAAIALSRICGTTNAVPALIAELQSAGSPYVCDRILGRLIEMGGVGKPASPTVVRLMQASNWPESSNTFQVPAETHQLAQQTLTKIDPEQAAKVDGQAR